MQLASLQGWVDKIERTQVSGWAIDELMPTVRQAVDVFVNNSRVATVTAEQYRDDLARKGYGDGKAGFWFDPSPYLSPGRNNIEIRYSGDGSVLLNGSTGVFVGPSSPVDHQDGNTNPWNNDGAFSYGEMWIATKACRQQINRKISGDENIDWFSYSVRRYMAPALGLFNAPKPRENYRCLILGATEGHMERELCRLGFKGKIVASDIADKALARAAERSRAEGFANIDYIVADLNTASFAGAFDYIIAEGVLHHVREIRYCLGMLHDALAPDGRIIMVEHHAPLRFQLPQAQTRWINAVLNVMPKKLRPFPRSVDDYLPPTSAESAVVYYAHPTKESVEAFDPSETISGLALRSLLPQVFDIVEEKGFGGTLLSYMTGHFPFALADKDSFTNAWLQVLIEIENTLIQTGILKDEFVFYVCKRSSASSGDVAR